MANRFWVGGTGTWDATTTTNWSATSGGAGGASAPTSADDVYFNADSNSLLLPFTVTVGTNAVCRDITAGSLDGALTFTMNAAARLNCYGSLTLPATNFTWSGTSGAQVLFLSTTTGKTITTNGVTLTAMNVRFVGNGGEWTLGSDFTNTGNLMDFGRGTFNTANFNVTTPALQISPANPVTINLGSSVVTTSATSFVDVLSTTNLTFNAGTSTLITTAASPTFTGGGLTYYNVSFTSTASGTATITGANTYNNLTFTSLAATGIRNISVNANQTINGTLTLGAANTAIRRLFVRSDGIGTPRTLTAATVATLADVDFRDIVGAGTGTWTGTRLGDCRGNTGITFDVSKDVYRVGTGNWSATQWSLTSGGSVDVNNFPLAQDEAIFDTGTTTGTHTVDQSWNIGTLDMSALTVAVTLATGTTTPSIYGSVTLDNDVTLSGTGAITFAVRTTQTITSSGKTFTQPLTIDSPSGTLSLADALITSLDMTLTKGTFDLNNQTATCRTFLTNNSNTRSLAFGTGKVITKGTGVVWNLSTVTGFTVSGTPVVDIDNNTAAATTVTTGVLSEANSVSFNFINGTYTLTDTTAVYRNLNFTGFAGTIPNSVRTIYGSLTISSGMTLTAGSNLTTFAATSGTNNITTAAKTLDFPITFNGIGGTWAFQDALTQGATRAFTITNGTVELKDSATSTTGVFATSGTNQKFLQSTLAGTQATLTQASGTVNATFLTVKDINATGGATWNALLTSNNVDAGNNSGWIFGDPPITFATEYTYSIRSFTQPRRF